MANSGKFLERRVGRCRMLDVVMVVVLGIAVAIAVVIIVTLTSPAAQKKAPYTTHDDDCIDIAVIGGGIGGAYTAWRMRDRKLSISVYEYTDRVGGRLFTTPLPSAPGTYFEMGGMRFMPGAHATLNKTATELGLKIIDFPLGFGLPSDRLWYVRGRNMRLADFFTDKSPYNLAPQEQGRFIGVILWDIFKNNLNISNDAKPSVDETYSLTTKDGIPLYKMSLDNLYGRYMSHEAYEYLLGLSGFEFSTGRHSAVAATQFTRFPGGGQSFEPLKTIDGGMNKIPQTLMQEFVKASTSHQLHLNQQLMEIERRQGGGYNLRFRKTQTTDGVTTPINIGGHKSVCARKVVLATQRSCILDIDFPIFKNDPEIIRIIDSVYDHKAGKVFLAYATPWWKTNIPNITHSKTDLPNRQTFDWSTGPSNVSVIMASYHDGNIVDYWRELSQLGTPIPGSLPGVNAVTNIVKERLEKYLSLIYNFTLEDIPEAVGGGMMLWDSYPYQAAWTHYKPGVDEREIQAKISKPSPSDDVYIVGNSWANEDLSTWAEGTLLSADEVLKTYFGINQ